MEEIRGLNMDLNDSWHFRKLIRKLRKWKMNLRNGTRVPGDALAGCENLSFEDFASWSPFSQVRISTYEIFAS